MAGYSKRSLIDKLGIKSGQRTAIVGAPAGYERTLGALPDDVVPARRLRGVFDHIQFFTRSRSELGKRFSRLKDCLEKDGMLWISWPKKASKVETDVTEDAVREIGLAAGLVDVKVCAVDDVWSGLKFVYRKEDR